MATVWIVNHYAGGPGIGTGWRHWELARRWIAAGMQVRVFTASTSIGGMEHPERRGRVDIGGVPFHFVNAPAYQGNRLGRLRNMLAFNRGVVAELHEQARQLAGPPDLVVASSPQPLMWPAVARAAQMLGARFIPEIRDLWPESLQQLAGQHALHPFVLLCRRADRIGLRCAAAVLSPLQRIDAAVRARGFADLPFIHVPNGVTLDAPPPPPLDADLARAIAEARAEGRFVALYAGAIGVPNAMDQFVEAFERMSPEARLGFRVLMVGDGSERERLAQRAAAATLPFLFVGPRPQEQVRALCHASDVGLLGWLDRPLYRFGIAPQKRGLMLGEGLPLLHAVPHGLVDEAALGTGWSVPAGDATAIAQALHAARAMPVERRERMRQACVAHARETLDWGRIAERAREALSCLPAR